MPRTVFASFNTEDEAERALAMISRETTLLDSAVLGEGPAGLLTLDSLDLTPEERGACEAQLKRGGFLLIAQAEEEAADKVLRVLHAIVSGGAPLIIAEAPRSAPAASRQEPVMERVPLAAEPRREEVVEEERIPVVEEELRIGKREVVRGGARVTSHMAEIPVQERVELFEEETSIERRPVNRRLTEEEVLRGGLLQERVIEVTAMREEAVVSKEAFVREELVVTKNVEQRVEQISDTVRRTEVETERLQPDERSTTRR